MQNSDSWEMNVTWMSQLERIRRILVSGNFLDGWELRQLLVIHLTPELLAHACFGCLLSYILPE